MEQHHVHHHHHHHYHYYYNHPFPPGRPPNAQGNGEPLNSEAAGRDDDEPSAEEDEEHNERGDTVDQHNPENRSLAQSSRRSPSNVSILRERDLQYLMATSASSISTINLSKRKLAGQTLNPTATITERVPQERRPERAPARSKRISLDKAAT